MYIGVAIERESLDGDNEQELPGGVRRPATSRVFTPMWLHCRTESSRRCAWGRSSWSGKVTGRARSSRTVREGVGDLRHRQRLRDLYWRRDGAALTVVQCAAHRLGGLRTDVPIRRCREHLEVFAERESASDIALLDTYCRRPLRAGCRSCPCGLLTKRTLVRYCSHVVCMAVKPDQASCYPGEGSFCYDEGGARCRRSARRNGRRDANR